MSDLVLMNPGAASLRPGAALSAPCYPGGMGTEFDYYGGSVAFGQVRCGAAVLHAACGHACGRAAAATAACLLIPPAPAS